MALTKISGNVIKDSVSLAGNVSIGGTLTYQDVTNIDAVGLITARTGIKVLGGGINAVGVVTATSLVGTGVSVVGVITATSFVGSGANLTSLPAQATIANNADNRVITGGSGVNLNGEANLTFDGSTFAITGGVTATALSTFSASGSALRLNDGSILRLGNADADFFLYHDGSSTDYISAGAGKQLRLTTDNFVIKGANNTETLMTATKDGSVDLYNNNVKVIETNTTGIQVGFDGAVSNPTIKLPDNGYLTWGTSDTAYIQGADAGSGGYLKFNANNGQRATIDGHGLKFGTDTAQANALDDYEEGTFTPYFRGDSSAGSYGYTRQIGRYTKIGQKVFFNFYLTLNAVNANGSGNLMIYGLPYTSEGGNTYSFAGVAYYTAFNGIAPQSGLIDISNTRLYLNQNHANSAIQNATPAGALTTTSSIIMGGHYSVG